MASALYIRCIAEAFLFLACIRGQNPNSAEEFRVEWHRESHHLVSISNTNSSLGTKEVTPNESVSRINKTDNMATSMQPASHWIESVSELYRNELKEFQTACAILLKLANNILRAPDNEKYRAIRVANPKIMEELLPVSGAMQCLFDMGFVEDGEHLRLPMSASLEQLRRTKKDLEQAQVYRNNSSAAVQQVSAPTTTPGGAVEGAAAAAPRQTNTNSNIQRSEAQFFSKLTSSLEHVRLYEDRENQRKALQCIPLDRLRASATKALNDIPKDGLSTKVGFEDFLILELLDWFKTEFFQWVDAPPCDRCAGQTQGVGMVDPTPQELQWGAGRVENYRCTSCSSYTRFPRYNHPRKLLETRRGRCGEWANCFTLCCIASGLEARYVLDWTDHVWTEVYSPAQKRWLHCDPCENICDKPLIYEVGWNKQLSYVIAFSKDDVQDVTWRYSCKHQQVLARRKECRETWLANAIDRLRKRLQADLPSGQKEELKQRLVVELVEFCTEKTAGAEEQVGRTSGSIDWRMARKEVQANQAPAHVIEPTAEELTKKHLEITYNCALDEYSRGSDKIKGWKSLVFETHSVFRKVENDWQMSYLARLEGTATASISWKLSLKGCSKRVKSISVQGEHTTYEDGRIIFKVSSKDQGALLPKFGPLDLPEEFSSCDELVISAELSQGKGDVAWQHTQLFRQHLIQDQNRCPFRLTVDFD